MNDVGPNYLRDAKDLTSNPGSGNGDTGTDAQNSLNNGLQSTDQLYGSVFSENAPDTAADGPARFRDGGAGGDNNPCGDKPGPESGDNPASTTGDNPASESGDNPAPTTGDNPASASGDNPTAPSADRAPEVESRQAPESTRHERPAPSSRPEMQLARSAGGG